MPRKPILLVTGLSGAGKSTVLRTLNDLGWEVVDNLPLLLLDRLLATELPGGGDDTRPLAIGFGARNARIRRRKDRPPDQADARGAWPRDRHPVPRLRGRGAGAPL